MRPGEIVKFTFQFQTGAIRSYGRKEFGILEALDAFQFQTGAIRRKPTTLYGENKGEQSFNSKLVRLEVQYTGGALRMVDIVCFNSKLVRLEGRYHRPDVCVKVKS